MTQTKVRIVVGVDGSLCSLQALKFAFREALAVGAEVEAVLVWSDPWAVTGPPSLSGAGPKGVARLKAILSDTVERAVKGEGATSVPVTQRVIPGHAAEVLAAESESARMLVVGTTGLSGLRRWMLGSVSQRCAQLARVPVVIVPPPERSPAHPGSDDEERATGPA
jgi:nucleotide-binding universal stress UspA family protein